METNDIRKKFFNFFGSKGHSIIPSASLIPEEDILESKKTLFTTAGMQQFKRYYLNPGEASYPCAASIQKCMRTSDIDEVGDKTHLTFFEMMGNFSFGYPGKPNSYFKKEAIKYAWEFLTKDLSIEKSEISSTYFKGEKDISEDRESLKILQGIDGLSKIKPQGFSDNFWSLGTEGSPGGPTVEFYVNGIEVWNLVFNEYIFKDGKYQKSKFKGVDTGMGLERLAAVLQGKKDVFEIDLFKPVFDKVKKLSKKDDVKSIRIICDHLRAATFILAEGIIPSNLDQGYVLRRLIRRAIRYGKMIEIEKDFCSDIAEIVIENYKDIYLELEKNKEKILNNIEIEEKRFRKVLEKGIKQFEKFLQNGISGREAFILFSTYGFPLEMTEELIQEKGLKIDKKEFWKEFKKHQQISRKGAEKKFKGGLADSSEQTKKLHTATHLLHQALKQVLGNHVEQKGSNITTERLRFDFSHPQKMTPGQIKKVEDIINQKIEENMPIVCEDMSVDEAKKKGAIGLFEHKYGNRVKVYSIGAFSKEICGGPHVKNTGELEHFKIKKEESSSSGIRRIKAVLE